MRRYVRALAAAAAVLVVVAACAAPNGSPPTAENPPVASEHMDRNRNRIFDDLDRMILLAATDLKVPVVVLMDQQRSVAELARHVGSLELVRQFRFVPALALRATREQIKGLAELPFVRQIELDATVSLQLNGASRWFGATAARQDFGLDGDRDGRAAGYSKSDIVVAVIDTGIDSRHVDLDGGKVIAWQDFVGGQAAPYDDNGHGSHVASIAAGTGEGNAEYKGVAPGAALAGLKVLDNMGRGSVSNLIAAVEWCIDNRTRYGIRVLSMSLGVRGSSDGTDTLSQVINRAVDTGMVAVVAAGNEGPGVYTIGSPGAAAKAITVGAIADVGEGGFYQAAFSSRGPTADDRVKPEVTGPGVRITAAQAGSGSRYTTYDGTSMATPFVSGTVALMLDANPNLTPAQVREILTRTALDWGPDGPDIDYGAGRLDAYAAVKAAGKLSGTGPALPSLARFAADLAAPAQQEYFLDVTAGPYPLALTLLVQTWDAAEPAYSVHLYNPQGAELARTTGTTRHQAISVTPSQTGRYRVLVQATRGEGSFTLDASGNFTTPSTGAPVKEMTGSVSPSAPEGWHAVTMSQPGRLDLGLDWAGGADLDYEVYGPGDQLVARAFGVSNPEAVRIDTAVHGTGSYRIKVAHFSGDTTAYRLTARALGRSVREFALTPGRPAAEDRWTQGWSGDGFVRVSWPDDTDVDFELRSPTGELVARGTGTGNPETAYFTWNATGTWELHVALSGGGAANVQVILYAPGPYLS